MASPGRLSLWHETADDDWAPRPALPSDLEADVAIVGAGYTGLWTAYYLAEADPTLRIVVLEAETAGFGASGRNGGWCSALFPAHLDHLARLGNRTQALAQHQAMRASVDEVLRVAALEGIDAHAHKGGTIVVARSRAQWQRAQREVAHARAWGRGEDDLMLLTAAAARRRLNATDVLGATFTPDCAVIHPARLVRGLARAAERRGVRIYEQTPVLRIEAGPPHGRAVSTHGEVRAPIIVRATEGYTGSLAGLEREVVPIYSLMIATEPLSPSTWATIGLCDRETFSDHRNLIVYGQRTADGRLIFGGRGAPYHWGSRIRGDFDRDQRIFAGLHTALVEMFPVLAGVRITHAWGGALGVARDWCASVGLDSSSGLGWAGGYVGDGVSTTNLAGRTLRDLILGHSTELTGLPWVNHRSPRWEPEPIRWLAANAGLRAMTWADSEEALTRRPSMLARMMSPLLG